MCRYGTSGHGLAGMVVLGGWLDFTILEVFSNLNDSMKCWPENTLPGTSSLHRGMGNALDIFLPECSWVLSF